MHLHFKPNNSNCRDSWRAETTNGRTIYLLRRWRSDGRWRLVVMDTMPTLGYRRISKMFVADAATGMWIAHHHNTTNPKRDWLTWVERMYFAGIVEPNKYPSYNPIIRLPAGTVQSLYPPTVQWADFTDPADGDLRMMVVTRPFRHTAIHIRSQNRWYLLTAPPTHGLYEYLDRYQIFGLVHALAVHGTPLHLRIALLPHHWAIKVLPTHHATEIATHGINF